MFVIEARYDINIFDYQPFAKYEQPCFFGDIFKYDDQIKQDKLKAIVVNVFISDAYDVIFSAAVMTLITTSTLYPNAILNTSCGTLVYQRMGY